MFWDASGVWRRGNSQKCRKMERGCGFRQEKRRKGKAEQEWDEIKRMRVTSEPGVGQNMMLKGGRERDQRACSSLRDLGQDPRVLPLSSCVLTFK